MDCDFCFTPTPYGFGDPLFYHFPLLRDIAQYIGHRILGRDRLSLLHHTESVSPFSVHLVSGRFSFLIIILQRYLLGLSSIGPGEARIIAIPLLSRKAQRRASIIEVPPKPCVMVFTPSAIGSTLQWTSSEAARSASQPYNPSVSHRPGVAVSQQ